MKKILVTGAGGFIGSHLTELLVQEGYDVRAFVRYNSKNNWGWLENSSVKNEIEVFTGDIRDYDSIYQALKGCNSVLHLAALIGIPYSYVSPKAYIDTNIVGTYNVLQASKELGLENIIITSTSETYGTAQYVPIDESHPIVGQSPYSATKIGADQIAISYYYAYNLPVKIIRPFNTYGPRQSARAVIPTILTQALAGVNKIRIGNLSPTRDLTFVLDTCDAFIEIYKSNKFIGEVTNVGTGTEISIKDICSLIQKLLGEDLKFEIEEQRLRPEKSEVERLVCNNSKIKSLSNWTPKYDLEKGLTVTINWFKENFHLYKTNLYNI